MVNNNNQKKHHAKHHIIWHLFGMANKFIKLSKQRCDTHCHTYIQRIITQQPQMRKMQTQHQNVQQDVQFKHTKFQKHWLKTHHFTKHMASKVQKAHAYTNPRPKHFSTVHNFWKNSQKLLDMMRNKMQKTTHHLDHYLLTYEFLK